VEAGVRKIASSSPFVTVGYLVGSGTYRSTAGSNQRQFADGRSASRVTFKSGRIAPWGLGKQSCKSAAGVWNGKC